MWSWLANHRCFTPENSSSQLWQLQLHLQHSAGDHKYSRAQLKYQVLGGTWKHRLHIWEKYFAVRGPNLLGCSRTGRRVPAVPRSPPMCTVTQKFVTSLDRPNNTTVDAMWISNFQRVTWLYIWIFSQLPYGGFSFTFCLLYIVSYTCRLYKAFLERWAPCLCHSKMAIGFQYTGLTLCI